MSARNRLSRVMAAREANRTERDSILAAAEERDDQALTETEESRFRELVEVFREQSAGLLEGGADLIIIETAPVAAAPPPGGTTGPCA